MMPRDQRLCRRMGFITATIFAGLILVPLVHAQPRSGHINWQQWSFDWEVRVDTGLALRDVSFDGKTVLNKASMPVIRVKYVKEWPIWHPYSWWPLRKLSFTRQGGKCGPFQDRISWGRIKKQAGCSNQKVCVESFFSSGIEWLEIGVFAEIGEYDIYQTWYLSADGQLNAIVQSGGLSCHTDHDHHVYWRFDFAVNGKLNDQVFVFDSGAPDSGWGPGWTKYTSELDAEKNPTGNTRWFIRDHVSGDGVWVLPGPDDGTADFFSDRDVSPRLFKPSEDESWGFGSRGDLGYEEGENIQETDIVFWYVGHLSHLVSDGPYPASAFVGPTLRVHR